MSDGDVRTKFLAGAARDDAEGIADAALDLENMGRIATLLEMLA